MKVRQNEVKNEVLKDREAELQVGEYLLMKLAQHLWMKFTNNTK